MHVLADEIGAQRPPIRKGYADRRGTVDHMAVREEKTVGSEDHSRAATALGVDSNNGGAGDLHCADDRPRIGVEQIGVGWLWPIEFWSQTPGGFDFCPARPIAVNTGYPARFDSTHLLGAPAEAISLKLMTASMDALDAECVLVAVRSGTLHGIGGWFEAKLSPSVTLTTSPLTARPILRRQVFFPIGRPVALEEHDEIHVRLRIRPAGTIVSWTVDVRGGRNGHGSGPASKGRFGHSTFQGMLLCREDLDRTDLGFVPRLTPWGQARRSVLELCDGRQTLAGIEREVQRRHPTLFRSLAEAAAFVTEVVTRYAV